MLLFFTEVRLRCVERMAEKLTLAKALRFAVAAALVSAAAQAAFESLRERGLHLAAHVGLAGACVAALTVGWHWRRPLVALMRSVYMAVALFSVLMFGCVLATLTVQARDTCGASPEEQYMIFRQAEANMWWAIAHVFRRPRPFLSEAERRYLAVVENKFGPDYARRERRRFLAAARAQAQSKQIEALADRWDSFFRFLYRVSSATRLNRAYSSWWLIVLLALLGVNLLLCTARRYPFGTRYAGFLAIHLGVLATLIGASIGALLQRRGTLPFVLGRAETAREFVDRASGRRIPLGFDVRVRDFRTVYHKELYVAFLDEEANALPSDPAVQRTLKVRKGLKVPLEGGKTVLEIEDYLPAAKLVPSAPVPGSSLNPAVAVELRTTAGKTVYSDWLYAFSTRENHYVDAERRFSIGYLWQSQGNLNEMKWALSPQTWAILTARLESTGERRVLAIADGKSVAVGPYSIKIIHKFLGVKVVGGEPRDTGRPENPAIVALVRKGSVSERRWVFDRFDFDSLHPPQLGDLKLSLDFLRYRTWRDATHVRTLLAQVGSNPPVLFISEGRDIRGPTPTTPKEPLTVGRSGLRLSVSKMLLRARQNYKVVPGSESQTNPSPAVLLHVHGENVDDRRWLVADSVQSVYATQGKFVAVYKSDTQKKPKGWYTQLEILQKGRIVAGGTVEVNHPMSYRGYSLYQADADPSRPNYTGIEVMRDPGWPLVKVGLLTTLVGICYVFFVQPVLQKRR